MKEEKPTSPAPSQTETAPTPPTEQQPPPTSSKLPPIIDDNSSFFSLNSFQKISAPSHPDEQTDVDHPDVETAQSSAILTDTLPNINTTEDWAAAFGFPRHASDRLIEEIGSSCVWCQTNVVYDVLHFRYQAAGGDEGAAGYI